MKQNGGEGSGDLRQTILRTVKERGAATIAQISGLTGVSYEGVRQQMVALEEEGWVVGRLQKRPAGSVGRPTKDYLLTVAGEHLFPKQYDLLTSALIETLQARLGIETLREVLATLTDARVRKWAPLLQGKTLEEKIDALKGLYLDDDPFMDVERGPEGIRLIERNCPFLNVAIAHPALCSISVSMLTRLLGVRVLREERFQAGDRRCVFRILPDVPVKLDLFQFEPEP